MTDKSEDANRGTIWRRRIRRSLIAGAALLIVVMAAAVGASMLVGSGVRDISAAALGGQPGDRISALMAYVETPTHSLQERNRAVWALGQLGDPRALPVLERCFTGESCDHERALCQYELKKAIRLCRGAANLSALVWRRGSLRQ